MTAPEQVPTDLAASDLAASGPPAGHTVAVEDGETRGVARDGSGPPVEPPGPTGPPESADPPEATAPPESSDLSESSDPPEPTEPPEPTDPTEPPEPAEPAGSAPGSPGPTDPGSTTVDFRMTLVASITLDLPDQHPSVVLREIDTPRRQLTFSIGLNDAVALSHAQRRIPTPRPLTHELLSDVLQRFDIDVVAVRIVGRSGSLHFAELDLRGRTGRSVLSCRPSDALTVALRQPVQVPILVDARLLAGDDDVAPPGADA